MMKFQFHQPTVETNIRALCDLASRANAMVFGPFKDGDAEIFVVVPDDVTRRSR